MIVTMKAKTLNLSMVLRFNLGSKGQCTGGVPFPLRRELGLCGIFSLRRKKIQQSLELT